MIDRLAFREVDPDCRHPRLIGECFDFLHGPGHVCTRDLDGALQAVGSYGCIVVHIPMIGPIKPFREGDVECGQTRGPGTWKDEVDIAPLQVHIGNTAGGVFLVHPRLDGLAVVAAHPSL